jgi:hypothetical protein
MRVHTRNPKFKVRLVSQKLGEFTFDTTHGSIVRLMTKKRMGQAAHLRTLCQEKRNPFSGVLLLSPARLNASR